MDCSGEENAEQLSRMKQEIALEARSLRRIISAYLNYPEAAEEDVRRYERSFRKLPPEHKALLSHLPAKYDKLRWCVSRNSYFIFEMLKAFEPPLDLSQDIEACENVHVRSASAEHPCSAEPKHDCCVSSSSNSIISYPEDDIPNSTTAVCGSLKEKGIQDLNDCNTRNHLMGSVSQADNDGRCSVELEPVSSETAWNQHVRASVPDWLDPSLQLHVPLVDVDKVRCIIRNIVRDWASEGQMEREQCYKPILQELDRVFHDRSRKSPPACLVPGAGLGRLALEISCIGFICQGNEFSYYMMICSSFILNQAQTACEWTIYPWIHSNSNSLSDRDQLRPVSIPDILPASAGITEGFSMCGGDFAEVYSDPSQIEAWDAVVTCFFLDTAHNIVDYVEIISRILKEGGVWINLGPLLYHFADAYGQGDEMSIELSLEDVKRVALHYGFEFENSSTIQTTYTTNPRSMMQNRYHAAFWTARKKAKVGINQSLT